MGKGPEIRKGTDFRKLREGYDEINWGSEREKRRLANQERRARLEAEAKEWEERDSKLLSQSKEIRNRLADQYSKGIVHEEIIDI